MIFQALGVCRQGFMTVFTSHFYIMGEAGRRRSVPWYDDTRTSSFKEEDCDKKRATNFSELQETSDRDEIKI